MMVRISLLYHRYAWSGTRRQSFACSWLECVHTSLLSAHAFLTVIPDATHPLSLGFRSFPPPYAVAPQQPAPPPPGPVRHWTPDDVVTFVQGTPGCGAYASAFLTNEIDGEALLLLAKDQFIQPPIGMKIGPALKLAARLESIRHAN
ncbi:hypothetical protein AHF37_02750 [Paragonimus kellicotti]|nr:hypothetical protein AHF37_02750 [Paragonimus kellicotti]